MKNIEADFHILIKKLYAKKTNSGGIRFEFSTIIEVNLLRSLLKIECEDYHIFNAIRKIDDPELVDKDFFEKSVTNIINNENERDQKNNWKIIIPFEIKINLRALTIDGLKFKIASYRYIRKKHPLVYNQFFQEQLISTKEITNNKIKYLIVETNGHSLYRAWKKIEPNFSILRGIIDFSLSYNSWVTNFKPEIRTSILHPEIVYGISDDAKLLFLKFLVKKKPINQREIFNKKNSFFNKIIYDLHNSIKERSIQELLSDIFRLYSQAMDEEEDKYCFLKFWQIVERIAMTESNKSSNEQVKKYLIFFTEPSDDYNFKTYLDKLAQKRNDLVHRGIDRIEDSDLNMMKSICDLAIKWIFINRKKLKTINHLDLFFSSRDINNSKIATTVEVLNFIKKKRK